MTVLDAQLPVDPSVNQLAADPVLRQLAINRRTPKILRGIQLGLVALFLTGVALNLMVEGLTRSSLLSAAIPVIINAVIYWLIWKAIRWGYLSLYERNRRRRHEQALAHVRASLEHQPLTLAMRRTWLYPLPGLAGLDLQRGLLCLQSGQTGYAWLVVPHHQLLRVGVDVKHSSYTHTYRSPSYTGGRVTTGGYVFATTTGGHSRSHTVETKTAVLEIHYAAAPHLPPELIEIDFGQDRQGANAWETALRRMVTQ